MKAIVVEDNQGIRDIVADLLKRRGHDVLPFPDAESAWSAMEHDQFELAVLDWGLPGMDGLELCTKLRSRPGGNLGFILFLTGRAEPEDLVEAIDAGANDYVAKPFRLDVLELRVAFAERQSRVMSEAESARKRMVQSEEKYRDLVERLPVITYAEFDGPNGPTTYVSPQVERVLGWSQSEITEDPGFFYTLIHPDDIERFVTLAESARHPGGHYMTEYRVRGKAGDYRWISDEAFAEESDSGVLIWHGVMADITARRTAEEALRESERQQRSLLAEMRRQATELRLLDRIRSALARELEPAIIYKIVTEATSEILGYPYVSVYLLRGGQLVLQHQIGYSSAGKVATTIPLGRGISGRVVEIGEPTLVTECHLDPTLLDVSPEVRAAISVPLRDGGEMIGVLNVQTPGDPKLDEGDLRLLMALGEHLESALSRSRHFLNARAHADRLRSVLESVQEIIFQADGDARWTFLNRAWEDVSGFSVSESLGRRITDFVVPGDLAEKVVALYDLTRGVSTEYRTDVRILSASGEVRWLAFHANRSSTGSPPYGFSGTLIDITERKRAEEALRESQDRFRQLAMHDPLTGLANRNAFMERLQQTLSGERGSRQDPIAVLFLDLDGFKLVNDSFGHDAGDRLLAIAADRIQACVRGDDMVARFGGDEFAILLHWVDSAETVTAITERILSELKKPCTLLGHDITVSASIGIVLHAPGGGSGTELLRNADTALYAAKGDGRNSYSFYEPEMSTAVFTRLRQETELRGAIDREDLVVYYQPAFDLRSGEMVGMEALVRWQHPNHALLPPDAFIALAESTGLIVPLGDLVLRRVCEQVRDWRERSGRRPVRVSVNLSARQLRQPTLVDDVAALLKEHDLSPSMLEFEITESALISNGPSARATLTRLRELGVSLALDDFGTGYASLSSLRDLPATGVKIDRSFTSGLGHDRASSAIIGAIVTLADALGLRVTAEGIETVDQLHHLRALGIPFGQGYYYTRPLPADAIESFVLGHSPVTEVLSATEALVAVPGD